MSFDYSESAALATELLTEFGQSITQRRLTLGTYTAGSVSQTPVDRTRTGAVFEFGSMNFSGGANVRGSLIQTGDKQLLLDPNGDVQIDDIFIIGSQEYTLVSIGDVNPAGTVVLYDLHIRKS